MSNQFKKSPFLSLIIASSIILSTIYFYNLVYTYSIPADYGSNVRSCYCVAFRLDDVEDFPYSSPLIAVMEVFKEKNIDLTIGVVGKNIDADNKQVYYYIKQRLMNNNGYNRSNNGAGLEIANHSWEHGRFLNFTFLEQSNSISKTNEKIKSIFGITPTIFIPPFSEYNNDTILAMHENNMRFISADDRDSSVYSIFSNSTIYHLPETAETGCDNCYATKSYPWANNSYLWQGLQHEETLNQIKKSIHQYGFAIVVIHPMEYSLEHEAVTFQNTLDLKQIRELVLLIDKIKKEGLHITTIGNMINHY